MIEIRWTCYLKQILDYQFASTKIIEKFHRKKILIFKERTYYNTGNRRTNFVMTLLRCLKAACSIACCICPVQASLSFFITLYVKNKFKKQQPKTNP